MSPEKRCATCHVVKPWTDYWAHRKHPDGTMRKPYPDCKVCAKAKNDARRASRKANPTEAPVRLNSEPLGEWIVGCLRRDPWLTLAQISGWFDVDEAVVRRWVSGERPTVDLDTVDRAFCRMGDPGLLNELWPVAVAA